MRVWRVEDDFGTGPYGMRCPATNKKLISSHISEVHPSPYDDEKLNWHGDHFDEAWHFGFQSKVGLYRWFTKPMRTNLRSHTAISVYEVDSKHVRLGERQCVFLRDTSKLIQRILF